MCCIVLGLGLRSPAAPAPLSNLKTAKRLVLPAQPPTHLLPAVRKWPSVADDPSPSSADPRRANQTSFAAFRGFNENASKEIAASLPTPSMELRPRNTRRRGQSSVQNDIHHPFANPSPSLVEVYFQTPARAAFPPPCRSSLRQPFDEASCSRRHDRPALHRLSTTRLFPRSMTRRQRSRVATFSCTVSVEGSPRSRHGGSVVVTLASFARAECSPSATCYLVQEQCERKQTEFDGWSRGRQRTTAVRGKNGCEANAPLSLVRFHRPGHD